MHVLVYKKVKSLDSPRKGRANYHYSLRVSSCINIWYRSVHNLQNRKESFFPRSLPQPRVTKKATIIINCMMRWCAHCIIHSLPLWGIICGSIALLKPSHVIQRESNRSSWDSHYFGLYHQTSNRCCWLLFNTEGYFIADCTEGISIQAWRIKKCVTVTMSTASIWEMDKENSISP